MDVDGVGLPEVVYYVEILNCADLGILGSAHFEHVMGSDHEIRVPWQAEKRAVSLHCDSALRDGR